MHGSGPVIRQSELGSLSGPFAGGGGFCSRLRHHFFGAHGLQLFVLVGSVFLFPVLLIWHRHPPMDAGCRSTSIFLDRDSSIFGIFRIRRIAKLLSGLVCDLVRGLPHKERFLCASVSGGFLHKATARSNSRWRVGWWVQRRRRAKWPAGGFHLWPLVNGQDFQ